MSSQFNFSPADLAYIGQHYIHLDHDQRWTGSAGAAYTLFKDTKLPGTALRRPHRTAAGCGRLHQRRGQHAERARRCRGYYNVNLAAVQTIKTGLAGPTQLRLDVINLLDRKYEIRDGTGVGVGAPQFGLRRTILAGISQRF